MKSLSSWNWHSSSSDRKINISIIYEMVIFLLLSRKIRQGDGNGKMSRILYWFIYRSKSYLLEQGDTEAKTLKQSGCSHVISWVRTIPSTASVSEGGTQGIGKGRGWEDWGRGALKLGFVTLKQPNPKIKRRKRLKDTEELIWNKVINKDNLIDFI